MKASPLAAVQFTVPGETISAKEQSRRRRRTYIRGVLSSLSEFIAVSLRNHLKIYSVRRCAQRRVGMYLNVCLITCVY